MRTENGKYSLWGSDSVFRENGEQIEFSGKKACAADGHKTQEAGGGIKDFYISWIIFTKDTCVSKYISYTIFLLEKKIYGKINLQHDLEETLHSWCVREIKHRENSTSAKLQLLEEERRWSKL